MKTETVRGFKDYTGEEALKRAEIRKILVGAFEKYGFEPAESPVIEYEEFVKGENSGDDAVSDIFKLQDKGKRKLALRYEFTFQLKRLMKNKKLPYKRYQIGEVFRDEPVGANRFRGFTQCDVDIIGSSVKDEAEVLALTKQVFDKLGIGVRILINNRKLLNEILDEQGVKKKQDVIKEIDKLDKLSEKEVVRNLKKFGAESVLKIFKKPESFFKKYNAYSEIEELKKYCDYYGVKVEFSPSLARGLSYYNGSIFEIKTSGMKETICAGGSYLVNGVQSTGLSFGLDRLGMLADITSEKEKYLVVSLGEDKKSIEIAGRLRDKGESVSVFYGKPSKALEYANAKGIGKVVFAGEKEIKAKRFKVKDMASGRTKLFRP